MDRTANKYWSFCIYLALAVSSVAVFQQVRGFDFVDFDDSKYLTENRHVSSGLSREGIIWAFTGAHAGMWHPLTTFSHMLDCELFGLNPHRHHLSALLFHTANTLLLFAVLKMTTGGFWQSAFVAAVFCLHPLNVESVAWVAERKNVLSTLFWILTMWAYTRYVRYPSRSGYFLTLLIFSMALMSKPTAVTLPFILLLLDYWPFGRLRWKTLHRLILEKVPFFILSIGVSIVTFYVQQGTGATVDLGVIPLRIRIVNALISYVKYICKMFWPRHLALPYPYHADRLLLWQAAAAALLLIAITVLVIRQARIRRYLPVGWLWYIGTLVPVIGLVQAGSQALADRYSYVPSIGIFIIIAWAVPDLLLKWRYRKFVLVGASLTVLFGFAIISLFQLRHWRNTITLFEHSLAVTDDNYVAHLCLAGPVYRQGRLDEAIRHYSQALRIRPNFTNIHYAYLGLGRAFFDKGDSDNAILNYQQALRLEPGFVEAHKRLAEAFLSQGKLESAAAEYRRAHQLQPDEPDSLNNLGVVLARQNRLTEAVACFNSALSISQDNVSSYINLGSALFQQGRYTQAVIELKKAVDLSPNSAAAHYHLARSLVQSGSPHQAIFHFKQTLTLEPGWFLAMNELAWILATNPDSQLRDPLEAARLAEHACELTGYQRPDLLSTLAAAYASAGRFPEAIATAEKALELSRNLNQAELTRLIESHLVLYRSGHAYIESSN